MRIIFKYYSLFNLKILLNNGPSVKLINDRGRNLSCDSGLISDFLFFELVDLNVFVSHVLASFDILLKSSYLELPLIRIQRLCHHISPLFMVSSHCRLLMV